LPLPFCIETGAEYFSGVVELNTLAVHDHVKMVMTRERVSIGQAGLKFGYPLQLKLGNGAQMYLIWAICNT
jgi:hypothetical protein